MLLLTAELSSESKNKKTINIKCNKIILTYFKFILKEISFTLFSKNDVGQKRERKFVIAITNKLFIFIVCDKRPNASNLDSRIQEENIEQKKLEKPFPLNKFLTIRSKRSCKQQQQKEEDLQRKEEKEICKCCEQHNLHCVCV